MEWLAPIDLYCERLGPGFWAEPLNAVSNGGFIAVAIVALLVQFRHGLHDTFIFALSLLVLVIGVGSFLFHTFANGWSVLTDVIPITLFIYLYLALALRRFVVLAWPTVIMSLVVFFGLSFALEAALRPLLSGSAAYAPALLAMLAVGTLLGSRRRPEAQPVLAAGIAFLVSLTLRTLDMPLCASWPSGTHFAWHLLNAATLATLLFAAIRHASCQGPRSA